MNKWTSCQYDDSLHLVGVNSVEGGWNPRQQAIRRSQEYEYEHRGCVALEVEGGFENCPIAVMNQVVTENQFVRGK